MENTTKFRTENSTYEIDFTHRRVRRLEGVNEPTPRQGPDGEWRTFASVYIVDLPPDDTALFFDWGKGTARSRHRYNRRSREQIFWAARERRLKSGPGAPTRRSGRTQQEDT